MRKTSLVDYPALVSSVFFFAGCNLRCPWCHNRELVMGGAGQAGGFEEAVRLEKAVGIEEALAHIEKRRYVLGGVVLSGGEPCLYEDIAPLIAEIKTLGLRVKLDTNGMFPAVLENLFSRKETSPDYIALDLKISPARYGNLVRPASSSDFDANAALIKSAAIIRESGIEHEYRTLALPGGFITTQDIESLTPLVDNKSPWYFRQFKGGNCLDSSWNNLEESSAAASALASTLAEKARELGKTAIV